MKITKQNWFEIFINNAPKISSAISRGDVNEVSRLIWTVINTTNITFEGIMLVCGEYALYSLKGIVHNDGVPLPILPKAVSLELFTVHMKDCYSMAFDNTPYINGGKTPQ